MGIGDRDLLLEWAIRNSYANAAAAAGRVFQAQVLLVVVKLLQAGAGVAQADAFGRQMSAAASQALAVVADFDAKLAAVTAGWR